MAITAILFDMDGILIDSEPFWRKAEVEEFGAVGLKLTEQDCHQTTGLRIDEVVAFRHAQHPWSTPSQAEVAERITARVAELVRRLGQPLQGAPEALEAARQTGLPLGLASSSTYRLIECTLESLGLVGFFDIIHSAQEEALGKPHPAVYLAAAAKLGVAAPHCLAIEDSLNGVIAAKAARMTVVAIPEAHQQSDPRFGVADHRLAGLEGLVDLLPVLVGTA